MTRIEVDVSGIEKTFRNFERDLHRGMERSVKRLARNSIEDSRNVIQAHDAIFNRDVYRKFKITETKNNSRHVRYKVYNRAEHAGALEYGVDESEYADGGPPVQALLPWVERKMSGWSLGDSNSSGGGSSGGPGQLVPLTGRTSKDDLSVSDEVFVEDQHLDRRGEILELKENTFIFEEGGKFEFDYDQIISQVNSHPTIERHGEWETGDQVKWFEGDKLHKGYIDGESSTFASPYTYYVEDKDDGLRKEIPESQFVDWDQPDPFDEVYLEDEIEASSVTSVQEAQEEILHKGQTVALYQPIEGETQFGTVLETPAKNEKVVVEGESGTEIDVLNSDWEIRGTENWNLLSKKEQNSRMLDHYDDVVDKSINDSNDPDFEKKKVREQLEESIFPSYRDREHLGRTIFDWNHLKVKDGRAHIMDYGEGYELQVSPFPKGGNDNVEWYWKRTFGHEGGHAYTQSTESGYSFYGNDPIEYKFANPWGDRDTTKYDHMYVDGLPKWEPDATDPVHAPLPAYFFTDEDGLSYVEYDSDGNIIDENRDQLDPYGYNDWAAEVEYLAKHDLENTSPSIEKMKGKVREMNEKQVFKRDNFQVEKGDWLAFDDGGETRILQYDGRDGEKAIFSESSEKGVPRKAEPVALQDRTEELGLVSIYVGDDGSVYQPDDNDYSALTEDHAIDFIGKVSGGRDESLDEFPDLTETDPQRRLQEAANMAFWYQVVMIANDPSTNHELSKEIVLRDGYSSAYAEEVMSTFSEAMTQPNIEEDQKDDLKMLAETYPYFIEEYLKTRKPISDGAKKILENKGFL